MLASNDQNKVLYPELSYELNGIFYKVHNDLGRFCRERQYGDAIEALLDEKTIPYQREHPVPLLTDKGVASNRVDFLINNVIIIELKAKRFINREDYYQMRRYLQALNLELGLLVNFQSFSIVTKRVLVRVE